MTSTASFSLSEPQPYDSLPVMNDLDAAMAVFDDFRYSIPSEYSSPEQDLSSPMFSSASSSPDGRLNEVDAFSMDFFAQHDLNFGSSEAASHLNMLSGPGPSAGPDSMKLENGPSFDDPSLSTTKPEMKSHTESRLSSVKPVPKPLNLDLAASMSMTTTDSPSPTQSASPFSSIPSSPTSPSYEDAPTPVVACSNCKRSHVKCDHGRPCLTCLKHPLKAATCRDAVPKTRGRPKGGSKAAAVDAMVAAMMQQHPGFPPYATGPFLHLHGQPDQPLPQGLGRQRAMSFPHISPFAMQQEQLQHQEMLMRQHEHRPQYHQRAVSNGHIPMHGPAVEFRQAVQPAWGAPAPGVPEMGPIAEIPSAPAHPSVAYTSPALDAYELQQLQRHRQEVQQLMEQGKNSLPSPVSQPSTPVTPHDMGMTRSMSDHFGGARAPVRHLRSEHHHPFMQQHPQRRQRPHLGQHLTLMIPSTPHGTRRVVSAGPSPVSATFPVSPAAFPASPTAMLSPPASLHSPTQAYHHHRHHSHHSVHLQQPPLSPMAHGPVAHGDGTSLESQHMAHLLLQELEIKHDLEMYEQQGYQKQQELARINMQKMKLQQQQQHFLLEQQQHGPICAQTQQQHQLALERFAQLQQQQYQQHQAAFQHEHQGRVRFHRRPSLQIGLTTPGMSPMALTSASGPL
ncbi:hypothetical protein BGZ54_008437, partial [Gamsiella multidivaricata]